MSGLEKTDREIASLIKKEEKRQAEVINLIASENYASKAVREAAASVLTNKYSEGYPGRRYYSGTGVVDEIEQLANDRCLELFVPTRIRKNWHANVQPYSGTNPNLAVYFSTMAPGDTALAMGLQAGGHLSHGSKISISGKIFNFVHYGVRKDDELIDFDQVRSLAKEHRPKIVVAGASAYSREIDFKKFREIADEVGSLLLVDMAHIAGLVAAGVHSSPIPLADFVTSSTHKTLRGPRGGLILCKEEFATALDKALFPGLQGGPLLHIIAAKAVCFQEAKQVEFKKYAEKIVVNAKSLAQSLSDNGLKLLTGGTDNHLMSLDFGAFGPSGKEVEELLDSVGIATNREMIPFDTRKPFVASGLRLGTAAVTTRKMGEKEMKQIGRWIYALIHNPKDQDLQKKIKPEILSLTSRFPLPD